MTGIEFDLFSFAVLPLHVELYRRFFPFFLRFPFFGCVLLPPRPPPSLAIAARAVAALAAPRVRAACSARATTFRSGAPKTCDTYSRKIAPRFMPCCSGTVARRRGTFEAPASPAARGRAPSAGAPWAMLQRGSHVSDFHKVVDY